jgi:hypothetical protein
MNNLYRIERQYKFGHPAKKAPHLHILIVSEKIYKLSEMVVHNINIRHRKRHPDMTKKVVSRRYPVLETPEKYIAYTMHQKSKSRFVEYDEKGILNDFDFRMEYEKYKPKAVLLVMQKVTGIFDCQLESLNWLQKICNDDTQFIVSEADF